MSETTADTARCDNCGPVWALDALDPVHDVWSRVEPGGVIPAGDCPDPDCGALCYPLYGYVYDLEKRLAAVEDVLGQLLAWEQSMGGWEVSVWEEVRRLLGRPSGNDPGDEETRDA